MGLRTILSDDHEQTLTLAFVLSAILTCMLHLQGFRMDQQVGAQQTEVAELTQRHAQSLKLLADSRDAIDTLEVLRHLPNGNEASAAHFKARLIHLREGVRITEGAAADETVALTAAESSLDRVRHRPFHLIWGESLMALAAGLFLGARLQAPRWSALPGLLTGLVGLVAGLSGLIGLNLFRVH